ncbi:hypothetical protein ACHAWX_005818 [Stephanocyclus meneghinianus]
MRSPSPIVLIGLLHAFRSGVSHSGSSTVTDCTRSFCRVELSPNLIKRYKITVPVGNTDKTCPDCKITVQLELDGYSWIGMGVSQNGGMVGSHVVIGEPGMAEPKAYYLNGKDQSLIKSSDTVLEHAIIDFINDRTIMEFTTTFKNLGVASPIDQEPIGISLYGTSSFIWAHGNDGENQLKYHGRNKDSYQVNDLSSGTGDETAESQMTMSGSISNTSSKWLAHGILAFISWGICAPLAVTAAIFRDFEGNALWKKNFSEKLSKWWFYIHIGCNSLNYFFTLVVFSVAVSTINKEGSPKWYHAHSKMGLAIFLLATFQVAGGLLRPAGKATVSSSYDISDPIEPNKTRKRLIWELAHNVLGIGLFLFGVWQIYAGMVLYNMRYGNSNFVALAFFYVVWMGLWTALIIGGTIYKWKYQKDEVGSTEEVKRIEEESAMENESQLELSESPNDSTGDVSQNESESLADKKSEAVFI